MDEFAANRARDRRAISKLRRLGYAVLVVWECEAEEPLLLERNRQAKLARLLSSHDGAQHRTPH